MDGILVPLLILAVLAYVVIRALRRRRPYMKVTVGGRTVHAGSIEEVVAAIRQEVEPVEETEDPPRELVDGTTLPATSHELTLELSSVNVEVVHDEAAEAIKFATTYPDHFIGEDGVIKQTDFRRTFRASNRDRLVVTVPAGFEGGLTLKVSNSATVNIDHWRFGEVEIESDAGFGSIDIGDLTEIGGLNVTSLNSADITLGHITARYANFTLKSTGDVKTGNITLTGDLDGQLSDDGNFACGDIKAANVTLNSEDDGDITTGHIDCDGEVDVDTGDGENDYMNADVTIESIEARGAIDLDNGGDGTITVNGNVVSKNAAVEITTRLDGGVSTIDINGRSVTITTKDDGDVTTGDIEALSSVKIETGDGEEDYLNADVTVGTITAGLEVEIDVGGDRNVTVDGDINVQDGGNLSITTRLDGGATMRDITAGTVAITTYDDGDVNTGEIKAATKVSIDTGNDDLEDYLNASVSIAAIAAGTRVEIDHGGDGSISIDGSVHVESGSFYVRTQQDGGVTINGVTARNVEVEIDDDGGIALGDVHSDDHVSATLSGDGDVTIGDLTCDSFKGQTDDDGNLRIGAASVHATFVADANDCGDITVASCVAAELRLTADETGTIYVNAGSAPKVFVSGDCRLADSFHEVYERR